MPPCDIHPSSLSPSTHTLPSPWRIAYAGSQGGADPPTASLRRLPALRAYHWQEGGAGLPEHPRRHGCMYVRLWLAVMETYITYIAYYGLHQPPHWHLYHPCSLMAWLEHVVKSVHAIGPLMGKSCWSSATALCLTFLTRIPSSLPGQLNQEDERLK